MTEAEYRMTKSVHGDACLGLGSMRVPRVGRYILGTTNFSLCLAIRQKFMLSRQQHQHPGRARSPERLRPLRRDPVGQRIGMKIGVITQAVPRTIWLSSLRNTVLFTRGKVVPRIVASDT
jgi:hypothetical protein